jgi:hypothetical protein
MADENRPRRTRATADDASFTRQLRYEFADAEGRAILYSYLLAAALGIIWILLVIFLPSPPNSINLLKEEEPVQIEVKTEDVPIPTPAPVAAVGGSPKVAAPTPKPAGGRGGNSPKNDTRAINDAFGGGPANNTGGMVGDVSNALRGTEVATGSGATPGAQGKAVIGYGSGGQSSRTPGRGGLGSGLGTGGAGGLGGVGGGGGVGFATVKVAPPSVIHAENVGGPGRNVSDLGDYVRGRNSQLQFCYSEYGLKTNPSLAGSVTVAVTLTSAGAVTGVDITKRTWSGPGASESESCIKQRISGWKFPSSDRGGGTYSFSFSFSR